MSNAPLNPSFDSPNSHRASDAPVPLAAGVSESTAPTPAPPEAPTPGVPASGIPASGIPASGIPENESGVVGGNPAGAQTGQSPTQVVGGENPIQDADQHRIGRLLAGLQENAVSVPVPAKNASNTRFENHLAMVRLGMATSLYYAMRSKHSPTAAHCLRVALACSAWSERLGLSQEDRDRMEVAGLLHDIGKIGIPDRILRKPGKLSVDEQLAMGSCPDIACEILRGCTSDEALLNIIRYADTWYDSRRQEEMLRGDALPLGSRMLAIASAFDAMTTDQVYRPALSRERAIQELIRGSGTQFDPELALDYGVMLEQRPELLQGAIVDRWLNQLRSDSNTTMIGGGAGAPTEPREAVTPNNQRGQLFFDHLTEHMLDGVVFMDCEGTVQRWNHAMTRMTGIAADAIVGQSWKNEVVRLRENDDARGTCPVEESLRTGTSLAKAMQIERPGSEPLPVHVQVSHVVGDSPGAFGTVLIIRDLSNQTDLEQRLVSLNEKATRDALTGVANRAEFDRCLEEMTQKAVSGEISLSLVICDIDHFKQVNDNYGHPAGDEALRQFARVLDSHSRDGDLVARYGGEEFLLLSPNCDNATATRRAEAIRVALENTGIESIGNQPVTASFGVTEFQSGDNSKTILARADRALLQAKDNGRNRVIQLGSGHSSDAMEMAEKRSTWLSWFDGSGRSDNNEFNIVTGVPLELAVEKLRGFIADHEADILKVTEDQLDLRVTAVCRTGGRRAFDQHVALSVKLTLAERTSDSQTAGSQPAGGAGRFRKTCVHARIEPVRNRDRRLGELNTCIEQVVSSLNSYLMGELQSIGS
ncbi:MAG: diguanylate cyclase [Planctomycetota bacterium]